MTTKQERGLAPNFVNVAGRKACEAEAWVSWYGYSILFSWYSVPELTTARSW